MSSDASTVTPLAEAAPITVSAGGTTYTLALNWRAIRGLETRSGQSFGQLGRQLETVSFSALAELMRACLERHHPSSDANTVDDILDEIGYVRGAALVNQVAERDVELYDGAGSDPRRPEPAPAVSGRRRSKTR